MKRILIVNNNMHIGGVQKALLNLLHELRTDYDITLLLFYCGGELYDKLPDGLRVISAARPFRYWGMSKDDTKTFSARLLRAFWASLTELFGRSFGFRLASLVQKRLSGFDASISFLHSGPSRVFYGGCNEFVLDCVDAKRKFTFLHCDYGAISAQSEYNEKIYQQFDAIAACSEGCKRAFLRVAPQFAEKTLVVPNFQNYGLIRKMAQAQPISLEHDRWNILTVARFGREKGIPRALRAVADLGEQTSKIHYYIIGDGLEYAKAQQIILDLGLSDTVFLLKAMDDPYGYMQAADVLMVPSYSEAAPMVICEAASLGTPILTTQTSSAVEMVQNTSFGWVCPNTQEGITQGIKQLLNSPHELTEKQKTLRTAIFDNTAARQSFLELINNYEKVNET